ncbi:MAG TPA: DUF2062 domain-containing protein [bacterium]|nr:DUF2062 domain-containing protein [bacterium]
MRGVRGKLKVAWDRLIRQDASPNAIAAGFAIGLFATFYPFPVLDTLAALAIAWCVRANKAACLIGNNFVLLIYPVIPLLLTAEVVTGRFLLRSPAISPPGNAPLLAWVKHQTLPNLEALVLGGLVLGIPSALLSFWLVRAAARKWQKRHATGGFMRAAE